LTIAQGTTSATQIGVYDLLKIANVNLDAISDTGLVTKGQALNGAPGGNYPFNRATGVCLLLDMHYMNFDVSPDANSGIHWFDHSQKVTCVVTVTRVGSWCSMGSEAVDFPTAPTFSQDSGSLYTQEGEVLDRYRQGIKIIFRQHGTIGVFSFFKVVPNPNPNPNPNCIFILQGSRQHSSSHCALLSSDSCLHCPCIRGDSGLYMAEPPNLFWARKLF